MDFLYRNETYGFQLSFPDAFKNAKIYTIPRYNDRFHDSRYDFDMVIIKLKDVYASL
ncbi:MAG: hypothetical protein LBI53_02060 [Candidatus Peribacteria bacterium]|nr:hypothetical protein [Candidatus Peribacteria bacterium]